MSADISVEIFTPKLAKFAKFLSKTKISSTNLFAKWVNNFDVVSTIESNREGQVFIEF